MDLIQKANKLGYKHYTEFTVEELDNLPLGNSNKQIEYYFIQKWLREMHNIHINVQRTDNSEHCYYQVWVYDAKNEKDNYGSALKISDRGHSETCIYSYEESLEKGLQEALKLI